MAMYEMQESNLPNEEGKRILYPRIRLTGQDTLDDVAKYIS
ncbi:MAG TPA: DNA-binding protein, partial [Bacteroides sp.]|nr:DNA-binding protein [Bacteroides sp.]